MARLGSLFDDTARTDLPPHAPRGRDLGLTVIVRRSALLADNPIPVRVPPILDSPDGPLPRTMNPADPEGEVTLHLPPDVATGTVVRLRGLGEELHDGHSGDLYLTVEIYENLPEPSEPLEGSFPAKGIALGLGLLALTGLLYWIRL